ncbi:MAG: HNH endonuclease [Butyrivibrio sp.]|uniref:HNH endonuclease n=1 Tax=Butyrivibrio sp. TaxID=28121 RepID=UPI001B75C2E8|nr:HNH endonuclease [Butyrivibrio sp.]MBP3783132.1 HNH endonuclease [Butyrivibrio sp.]
MAKIPTKWLISANKSFDTVRAFNELKTLDWNQGMYKLEEGDIVYIYLGKPIQKIRLKCKVVKANMATSDIDDRKYITGITDEELEEEFVESYGNSMRLTVLSEFVESDLFGAKALAEHGVRGQIRTPRKITEEVLDYIEQIDAEENTLKKFSKNRVIINELARVNTETILEDEKIDSEEVVGKEREILTKARVNQSRFRQKLLERYDGCAICGMNMSDLLVASHIKPWAESSAKEKTSVENGLLLCPNHDKLFDKGYIAFENDGSVLISSLISKENYDLLGIDEDMKIELTEANVPYIEYHRKNKHIW